MKISVFLDPALTTPFLVEELSKTLKDVVPTAITLLFSLFVLLI